MLPALEYSFRIDIHVDKPVVISSSPLKGKRQLIPIRSGTVSGALNGQVMPGGIDSQFIDPDGICRLSARYALQVGQGTVYVENNGVRRVPDAFKEKLFGDDMRFFDELPPSQIYFRSVPVFETDVPELSWLTTSVFICAAERTASGVTLEFYKVV